MLQHDNVRGSQEGREGGRKEERKEGRKAGRIHQLIHQPVSQSANAGRQAGRQARTGQEEGGAWPGGGPEKKTSHSVEEHVVLLLQRVALKAKPRARHDVQSERPERPDETDGQTERQTVLDQYITV